jgi:hypothetical protein
MFEEDFRIGHKFFFWIYFLIFKCSLHKEVSFMMIMSKGTFDIGIFIRIVIELITSY